MNRFFQILLISGVLYAQSDDQIKQAKEHIKKTGMSEADVRAAAKAQGYSDQQIEAAIQKELNATSAAEKLPNNIDKKMDVFFWRFFINAMT